MTMPSLLSTVATHFRGGFAVGLRERTGRIAGGMRERQLAGHWAGRIPFGYRRRLADFADGTRGWDGGLEIEPTEAEGVRWAFGAWLAGASRRTIAAELNARGHRSRIGRPWTARAVKTTLANPVYVGKLVRYRRHHPDHYFTEADPHDGNREVGRPFPAIVTDAVFEAAQARSGWPVRPTAWTQHVASLSPERRADLRAAARERARRWRQRNKTNRTKGDSER